MLRHGCALVAPLCFGVALIGQESRPQRSLADGLVRQVIETRRVQPPYGEAGEEVGTGKGKIALLHRHRDGRLELTPLRRGHGDHGPAAKPSAAREDKMVEQEMEAIFGKPKKKPGQLEPKPGRPTSLTLRRVEGEILLEANGESLFRGVRIDRQALGKRLESCFAKTKGTTGEGRMSLTPAKDVPFQDMLTAWEVARSVGYRSFALGGPVGPMDRQAKELFAGLQKKLGWKRRSKFVMDGELLLLVEKGLRWRDVEPLFIHASLAGVWQLAVVTQKDAKTRFKLPMHLPVARAFK